MFVGIVNGGLNRTTSSDGSVSVCVAVHCWSLGINVTRTGAIRVSGKKKKKRMKTGRILWDTGRKSIDEIVLLNVDSIHVEQMDDRCWWIGVYVDNEHYWMGNFTANSRGKMMFTEQENAGVIWDYDDEHVG